MVVVVVVVTPSHQAPPRAPNELLADLKELADEAVAEAATLAAPPDVHLPAGGSCFYLEHRGVMVVSDPSAYVCAWGRSSADRSLSLHTGHGWLSRRAQLIWGSNLRHWRRSSFPATLAFVVTRGPP